MPNIDELVGNSHPKNFDSEVQWGSVRKIPLQTLLLGLQTGFGMTLLSSVWVCTGEGSLQTSVIDSFLTPRNFKFDQATVISFERY